MWPVHRIEETTGYALAKLGKAHRQAMDQALGALGLHVGQEMVLLQLWAQDGLTPSQLAERLAVEPPTVTKMVQRMTKAGLVERRSAPEDARSSRIHLTGKGRALQAGVLRAWNEVEERTMAGLSTEERTMLQRLLLRVRRNLE